MGKKCTNIIDWLSISQEHSADIKPLIGDTLIRIKPDGEIKQERNESYVHEGSHDTTILVKSEAGTVSLIGNIGALDRPDNVFGYDFEQVILKTNQLMTRLNLPEFTSGEHILKSDSEGNAFCIWTGAKITRIDVTRNYESGSYDNLIRYMHYLSGRKPTRMRTTAMGSADTIETVANGHKSAFRSFLVYNKAAELRTHKKKFIKEPYYKALLEYLENNGVVRFECRLKRLYLRRNGFRYLGNITLSSLNDIADEFMNGLLKPVKISSLDSLSNSVLGTYYRWKSGDVIKLCKSSFYGHRKKILEATGLDISNDYNSQAIQSAQVIDNINLQLATPYEGYYLPPIKKS